MVDQQAEEKGCRLTPEQQVRFERELRRLLPQFRDPTHEDALAIVEYRRRLRLPTPCDCARLDN